MANQKKQCSVCGGYGSMIDGSQCPQCRQPIIQAEAVEETAEVIQLNPHNTMSVEEVLHIILKADVKAVVVTGEHQDGTQFTVCSTMRTKDLLWFLEASKFNLMHGGLTQDEN